MSEDHQIQPNKKSDYELRREQKLAEQKKLEQRRMAKKTLKVVAPIVIIVGGIGALIWYVASRPPIPEEEIISRRGIHWHPELAILIKGEKQEISANIGIGGVHQPIHTHDTSGTLHLEIEGFVTKQNTILGRFFKIWGTQFTSSCIFEFCNGTDGTVKMVVNGKENTEFENYQMQDGDKIEIRYE